MSASRRCRTPLPRNEGSAELRKNKARCEGHACPDSASRLTPERYKRPRPMGTMPALPAARQVPDNRTQLVLVGIGLLQPKPAAPLPTAPAISVDFSRNASGVALVRGTALKHLATALAIGSQLLWLRRLRPSLWLGMLPIETIPIQTLTNSDEQTVALGETGMWPIRRPRLTRRKTPLKPC
jgi:hypothetical protein